MIRKSVYTLAAVLTLAGCSKEELTETTTEGISSVASPTNGNARFGNPEGMPDIWFNPGTSRVHVQLNGNTRPPLLEMQIVHQRDGAIEDPNDFVDEDGDGNPDPIVTNLTLARQGNSKNYRSQEQFVFGTTTYFSLLDVTLTSNTFIDDWQGETAYLQLFVYPSGRTVEQDPKVMRVISGRWDGNYQDNAGIPFNVVLGDDPAQEVATVALTIGNEVTQFEKTHENQNLGLSRWTGDTWSGTGTTQVSESLMLRSAETYDVDFLTSESNARIIANYDLTATGAGPASVTLSDEPVILGSRLGSTSFGEQWQLEIAIADLGDWVETVNYVFEPGEGPSPLVAELPMQLTRTEGNLRVYTSPKFSFNGNPTGNDVGGIVYLFGTGTRTTTTQANNKAELL